MRVNGPHCGPYAGKERQLYGGEQTWAFSAGNRHLQSNTTLRSFMPAHRLFTHASALAPLQSNGSKHSHTHTHTDTQIFSLSIGPATKKTQKAGWQEIRAEVREGWKEVQPKRRKHQ